MSAPLNDVDPWAAVVGQDEVVERLRRAATAPTHAYLFVGAPGYGTRAAARAFAADLLSQRSNAAELTARHRRLAVAEEHPSIRFIERSGPAITADQAREIVRLANMAPPEADRQVLVLTDFHLVKDAAPILLKSIEEPPAGTIFVILADDVPSELVTIESRCAKVEFAPVAQSAIRGRLVQEGIAEEVAQAAAASSGGDMDRARLLVTDDRLVERREFWRTLPERLDGTGTTAAALATEAMERVEEILVPLKAVHDAEMARARDEVERWGQSKSRLKVLEAHHKREQRRVRTPEFKAGLAAIVDRYREEAALGRAYGFVQVATAVDRLCDQMIFNPNLDLALQALMVSLPILGREAR